MEHFIKISENLHQSLILSTPMKRKLLREETVQNMIVIFDRANPTIQLGGTEESPAKRRLVCRNRGGQ